MHNKVQRMSRALVSNGGGRLLLAVVFMFQVASALQAASINLAWDANTEPLAGYNIYRSTQSGVFTSGPLNGSAPLNTTSFSDSTVSSGTYYYVIKAVSTDGIESGSSNQVQATVASVNSSPTSQPLVEPSGLAAQCNDGRTFTVSWNPVVGAENYYLRVDYVANNANGNWYITDGVDYSLDAYAGTSFTGSVVAGQRYQWWVHGANAATGIGPSSSSNFLCGDTTSPSVSITNPTAGATITGTVTISAAASDNVGVAGVQFRLNGANLGAEVTTTPYSVTWDISGAANGSYTLTAVARDGLGNQTTSAPVTITVNKLALVAATGLTSQCSNDGKSFTVSWNPVTGAENYYLRVDYLGNNAGGTESYKREEVDYYLDKYTGTSFTGSVIAGSSYSWWVHGANTASGIGPAAFGSFTCRDTTAPLVSITGLVAGSVISLTNNPTISASASDNVGVVGVQFKLNGVNLGNEDTTAPYSVQWNTKKTPGIYTIQATARDAAGNQATSGAISVKVSKPNGSNLQVLNSTGVAWGINSELPIVTNGYAALKETNVSPSNGVAIISLANESDIVSEASVMASAPIRSGRIYISADGAVNTGLAIANNQSEAAVISFYFTDTKGSDFGNGSFTLEPKHNLSAFANEAPFNLPVSADVTMTFSSSVPIAVTAIRGLTNQRGEFLMTTLPVAAIGTGDGGGSIVMPHFVNGGGWSTQVILTNPTDVPLSGTVQFLGSDSADASGVPLAMTVNGVTDSIFEYSIAPRSAVRFVTDDRDSEVHVGFVLTTAKHGNAIPQGLSIFSFSSQGITISETGVPTVSTGTAFRTYVEKWWTLHSGLAFANASASSVRTTLELTTLNGSSTTMKTSLDIPPNGHVASYIDEFFPSIPEGFEGVLKITSTQPVAATGLRIRTNGRGDVLMTAMPIINEASPVPTSDLLFPLVVQGGGFSTEFINMPR